MKYWTSVNMKVKSNWKDFTPSERIELIKQTKEISDHPFGTDKFLEDLNKLIDIVYKK